MDEDLITRAKQNLVSVAFDLQLTTDSDLHCNYRVAQNKPDYLRLLPTFYISTTKHVSLIMYM